MELDKFGTAGDIQELLAVRDRIDDLLQRQAPGDGLTPRVDLLDHGDAFQLVAEVPGVSQENLEVALNGTELTIAGLRETQQEEDEALVFGERPRGPFQRTVELPGHVDREGASGHLREGLLVLHLPKA